MGLRRRKVCSSVYEVVSKLLHGSGSSIGYRAMHKRLMVDYNLVTDGETVRQVLKIVDPAGVQRRSKHRLKRRSYKVKGPNYIWHVDGYDKLKPFGFCIHGALDGYSRRVLWLEVDPSNNDPKVVGQYYINYICQIGGAPRLVRADCGTENVCTLLQCSDSSGLQLMMTSQGTFYVRKVNIQSKNRSVVVSVTKKWF